MEKAERMRIRHKAIWPHLDEKGRRLWAASEAQAHGRGGLKLVHEITGISRSVIIAGIKELAGEFSLAEVVFDARAPGEKRSKKKTSLCLMP